jgi:hypothetical protein
MTRCRPIALLGALLILGIGVAPDAIAQTVVLEGHARADVSGDFGDVAVAGGTLRMPLGGPFAIRPSRKDPTKLNEGTLTITYWGLR